MCDSISSVLILFLLVFYYPFHYLVILYAYLWLLLLIKYTSNKHRSLNIFDKIFTFYFLYIQAFCVFLHERWRFYILRPFCNHRWNTISKYDINNKKDTICARVIQLNHYGLMWMKYCNSFTKMVNFPRKIRNRKTREREREREQQREGRERE